ncbi:MAG TPA: GNAT family N-acetyltransferase [Kiritimatiellia bacterium]|nr:GNAT family N-acetyltransferase [Kiritimatiellia bacterium]
MTVERNALESDAVYFEMAARKIHLPGCEFVWMPELEELTSASTAMRVDMTADPCLLVRELEACVIKLGLPRFRIYLDKVSPEWSRVLTESGYKMRTERVQAATGAEIRSANPANVELELLEVVTLSDWSAREELFGLEQQAPDGHVVNARLYIEMEKRKRQSGAISFYLARGKAGGVVASYGIMKYNGVVRLKNFIVHPDLRGKGVGSQVLTALSVLLPPDEPLIAFAVTSDNHPSLYDRNNFKNVGSCHEWTRSNR